MPIDRGLKHGVALLVFLLCTIQEFPPGLCGTRKPEKRIRSSRGVKLRACVVPRVPPVHKRGRTESNMYKLFMYFFSPLHTAPTTWIISPNGRSILVEGMELKLSVLLWSSKMEV